MWMMNVVVLVSFCGRGLASRAYAGARARAWRPERSWEDAYALSRLCLCHNHAR